MLIDIFVPGLLDIPVYEVDQALAGENIHALETIFRYGSTSESRLTSFDQFLTGTEQGIPSYVQGSNVDSTDHKTILARPVHFKTDMQNAHLLPLDVSQRSEEDCRKILTALVALFSEDFSITEQNHFNWLMTFKTLDAPQNYPHPLNVLGRKINPYVEQSRKNLDWYRLNNEIQMFMHQHEVNADRQRDGLPVINGLWFWGANNGLMSRQLKGQSWVVDDSELKDYLSSASGDVSNEFNAKNLKSGVSIVHLSILKALKGYQSESLVSLIRQLDSLLISPALDAVNSHGASLQLNAGNGSCWGYTRKSNWLFWKQPKSYLQLLSNSMNSADK